QCLRQGAYITPAHHTASGSQRTANQAQLSETHTHSRTHTITHTHTHTHTPTHAPTHTLHRHSVILLTASWRDWGIMYKLCRNDVRLYTCGGGVLLCVSCV